ncbi:hypothetical protein N0V86_000836 [Didymella sp. IMI 355093]|nr:hypothetical protein N0V86_000836 [Didymella sp. IMI 355093]
MDLLRLHKYGILVRFAQPAHGSGLIQALDSKPWKQSSSRAVLHCIAPTKSALPILKLEALVNRLVEDCAMIEVTVLADYKNYSPLEADDVSSSAILELFRSTVGVEAQPSGTLGTETGKKYREYEEAVTKEALEAKAWRRSVGEELPYMTVADVPGGSANGRAFKLSLEAAVEAIYIEVVLAEKRYGLGLDLINYLEKLCAEVELYQVFR